MLFKYSGKYVNIYFNMKITFISYFHIHRLALASSGLRSSDRFRALTHIIFRFHTFSYLPSMSTFPVTKQFAYSQIVGGGGGVLCTFGSNRLDVIVIRSVFSSY